MKTLWQIFAISRTEIRFGLRRGVPVVTTLIIGLVVGGAFLWDGLSNLSISKENLRYNLQSPAMIERLKEKGLPVDYYRQIAASTIAEDIVLSLPSVWPILLLTSFLLLPASTSTSLPSDRSFGMAELVFSMPISAGSYLVGKVLGVLVTVMMVGLIPLGAFFGVLQGVFQNAFQVGVPVDMVSFFVRFTLLDGLPILGLSASVGILVGSVFHSRRSAVFPGILAGILGIFLWRVSFGTQVQLLSQVDVAAYYVIQNYHSLALDTMAKFSGVAPYTLLGDSAPMVGFDRVILMYLIIVITLVGLTGLCRLWLKWKENF